MTKRLLVFVMSLCSCSAAFAQDPLAAGIVANPASIPTSTTGTIQANIGNGSATAIPQANNATWTFNLPPNVGVTGVTTDPVASNFSVTIGTYSPSTGTVVTLVSNQGDVPGSAAYLVTLNIIGLQPTGGTPAPISVNAATTPPLGTNNSTNDNANTTITVTGAMPVGLLSFTAKALEDRTVQLDWVTSLETNNKGFLIERSKDLKNFEKAGEIGEVAANSSAKKYYTLIDQNPFAGTSYYRLTQIDLSGKTTTFPAVSVVVREGAYGVFPNPVVKGQQFMLSLDEPETAVVKMFASDGRTLPLQKAGVQSGSLLLRTTANLSAGLYIVTVEERGLSRQHRIVVE